MLDLMVRGLGPIKRAVLPLRGLMVVVGPNRSGKSYLAMLLWVLHLAEPELLDSWRRVDGRLLEILLSRDVEKRVCRNKLRELLREVVESAIAEEDSGSLLGLLGEAYGEALRASFVEESIYEALEASLAVNGEPVFRLRVLEDSSSVGLWLNESKLLGTPSNKYWYLLEVCDAQNSADCFRWARVSCE